jgi:hypothetical protein
MFDDEQLINFAETTGAVIFGLAILYHFMSGLTPKYVHARWSEGASQLQRMDKPTPPGRLSVESRIGGCESATDSATGLFALFVRLVDRIFIIHGK